MIEIRVENPADYKAIRMLTKLAFDTSQFGHNGEADIVDSLRSAPTPSLSLVACIQENIVGHVLFSQATIRNEQTELFGMALGPMSVAPEHQRSGIGSMLVRDGIRRLFLKPDCEFVVVLGHADYYPRFGFQRADQFNVTHGFAGIPQDLFFIQFANKVKLDCASKPQAYYHSQFGPQHADT